MQYLCLLRGINVGKKQMKMAEARQMFEDLGYTNVQSVLASGNISFESNSDDVSTITERLEKAIVETFGFESRVLIITAEDVQRAIEHLPFTQEQRDHANIAMIVFLSEEPEPDDFSALLNWHEGDEVMTLNGRELYIYYVNGSARSKLTLTVIEKYLKVIGTARNLNTVETRLLPLFE